MYHSRTACVQLAYDFRTTSVRLYVLFEALESVCGFSRPSLTKNDTWSDSDCVSLRRFCPVTSGCAMGGWSLGWPVQPVRLSHPRCWSSPVCSEGLRGGTVCRSSGPMNESIRAPLAAGGASTLSCRQWQELFLYTGDLTGGVRIGTGGTHLPCFHLRSLKVP